MDIARLFRRHSISNIIREQNRGVSSQFSTYLKDIGLNIDANLFDEIDRRRKSKLDNPEELVRSRLQDRDVLLFITTVFTSHLIIDSLRNSTKSERERLLVDESYYKIVKNRITHFQYRIMLHFYYKHTKADLEGDPLLLWGDTDPTSKNYKMEGVNHFVKRAVMIEKLIDRLKLKYRGVIIEKSSDTVEHKFIEIHNMCCQRVSLEKEMIGFMPK